MKVSAHEKRILEWFDYFHAHPETSWKEIGTTNRIAAILDELQVAYRRLPDSPGLIAEIGEGQRAVAVRADIDALWQEVDGIWKANHSCGHDAHIAMVLGALLYVLDSKIDHKIRFIFQPAEEKGNGSLEMIKHGAMEDVTHFFGVHVRPAEEMELGQFSPAIRHGAAIFLEGKIRGEDAHGARPHQGKNGINVIMAIHQFLKDIYFSPWDVYSAKLTKIQAGGESLNIIPGTVEFAIDIRAQKNDILEKMKECISAGLNSIAQLHNCPIEFEWKDYTPGAVVSPKARAIAEEAIIKTLGKEKVADDVQTSGSDDFHFYTIEHPEVSATMIGVGAAVKPGLHHPQMTFERSILDQGARVLAAALLMAKPFKE
ncbi:amidohydrolase [Bacillus sp. 1P06AnD]|uniref:amidohydrolase n=1 Tax=Bacillus sp. 1P06AnD TaxID=3132208 RepID=UPI0039A3D41C